MNYKISFTQIRNHNAFLNSILTHAETLDCHYKKYLPAADDLPKLHATEFTSQACIVPFNDNQFLKLINSHYVYNVIHSITMCDLNQLEQDVVKFYIAGKPIIITDDDGPGNMRNVFRFRNLPTEITQQERK